jgi:hypothetical protein
LVKWKNVQVAIPLEKEGNPGHGAAAGRPRGAWIKFCAAKMPCC